MTATQRWQLLAAVVIVGVLLYLLAPVLSPFLFAALLAYLGDPLVDRLEARKISRTGAVVIVFLGLLVILALIPLLLIPLLEQQIQALIAQLPHYLDRLQNEFLPWLSGVLGVELTGIDLDTVRETLRSHWQQVGGVAGQFWQIVTQSGLVLLGWFANLILVPVVTFYLLRDWDVLVARIRELIPRRYDATLVKLTVESDEILGAFLRGQLLVMLGLGIIYTTGLWIVGLDLALLVGMVAGLVSFVPYLGFIVGILFAGIAALMQFGEWLPLLFVVIVFGVGQAIEGMVLTPLLVGDRIGLHPVAVIFAVLAGGQLFGFVGVLMALPVAAVVMVLLRHAHQRYTQSTLYSD